jgi:hypothetical protein
MNIVPSTNGSVALSLAPRADTGFLDLVEWTVSTGNITRIIQLGMSALLFWIFLCCPILNAFVLNILNISPSFIFC